MLRRLALAAVAAAILSSGGLPLGAPAADELRIYNWSDYIAEDTIESFRNETGIDVTYDVFDSNEVLETKLLAGRTGFDLVVPSDSFLARQIKAGVFAPLDKSKLPNLKNLDPEIMERVARFDPGNEHSVPYLWGTAGLGYNIDMIKARLPDAPLDSWALLFDPANAEKLADCGIALLDAPSEVLPAALNYLGYPPFSGDSAHLEAVEEMLLKIRPYIRYFQSSQYINDLANGEICLALGWSGDILQARDRADEAGKDVHIAYMIPKEGAQMWFDMMAIPADAPNPDAAHAFINYVLRPEVIAGITNYVAYANPNAAAEPLVDPAVRGDPGVYPPPSVRERLFPADVRDARTTRAWNRVFTRIKTGR